jgi:uncharacterized protein YecT (DUF1311 family)
MLPLQHTHRTIARVQLNIAFMVPLMSYRRILIAIYLVTGSAFAAPTAYCDSDKPDPIDINLERELEKSGGVTVAIREAQGRAYEAWDKRLNAAYRTLQSKVSDSDRKLLIQAQRDWLKFRDTHFQYIWSKSMLGNEGTLGPIVVGDWSRDMLKQRVCELERAVRYLHAN